MSLVRSQLTKASFRGSLQTPSIPPRLNCRRGDDLIAVGGETKRDLTECEPLLLSHSKCYLVLILWTVRLATGRPLGSTVVQCPPAWKSDCD